MTLAIAHCEEGGLIVVDCVRERKPPFAPDDVVKEFAKVLGSYRIGMVRGDRYGGEWPRERFHIHGIEYHASSEAKSELYIALLPALNSRRIDLVDNPRLVAQLCGLERRVGRGGRDSIDHRPGAHDDLANAVAGVAAHLMRDQSFAGKIAVPILMDSYGPGLDRFDFDHGLGGGPAFAPHLDSNKTDWPVY